MKMLKTLSLTLGCDFIQREQALDFFRNRSFRESLICRTAVGPRDSIDPREVAKLAFKTDMRVNQNSTSKDNWIQFYEPDSGRKLETQISIHTHILSAVADLEEQRWFLERHSRKM